MTLAKIIEILMLVRNQSFKRRYIMSLRSVFTFLLATSCTFSLDLAKAQDNFNATYEIRSEESTESQLPERYEDVEGMEGMELLKALHRKTGIGYKEHGYSAAKQFMYDVVDNRNGKVFTLYSGSWANGKKGGTYKEHGDANEDGHRSDFVNCEHTWPQSKFGKRHPMRSDIHHLYPTYSKANGYRGSNPFGEVNGSLKYSNSFGSQGTERIFEPADEVKGNVARAQLYFYVRYHNRSIFQKGQKRQYWLDRVKMFMEWSKLDPVDDWERTRNDLIEKYQGNRNPFIDYPGFAEKIGEAAFLGKERVQANAVN